MCLRSLVLQILMSGALYNQAMPQCRTQEEEEEKFYMLQPANKSDRMCHLVAMTMRSSCSSRQCVLHMHAGRHVAVAHDVPG